MQVSEEKGSRENPIVVAAGERTVFSYHVWRPKPCYFQIRLKSGHLSEPIGFSDPFYQQEDEISARCSSCGEGVKATIKFV